MSGSSKNTIEDTPERRMLAKVGAEQWNYAQETLAPLQNQYMAEVDQLDSAERKQYITGFANTGMQNAMGSVGSSAVTGATANGLDVGSGRVNGLMTDGYIDAAAASGDVAARALAEQDRQKVIGLQNVVAMGSGQQTQAVAGLSDISELSSSAARDSAQNAFNRRAANLQALGQIAGMGTSYYMNQPGPTTASQMRLQDGGGQMVNNGNDWDNF